ncbi:restriction endonuclease subunit M [Candidatus Peribacteria bacterium RIFCSPLOWO2_01_FULL_54_110]|nr:MAG: restriction endonuclease subunit M [Candidatus Peribacteria bacterium RIFCSPLOWO2_01_FULL_54_110]
MPAPQKIIDLVERFEQNKEAYQAAQYNETQVRREFIDPLFKALGWDIDNEQGYAEAYKDVVHEDAIHIGGIHKAPDYCMRIGGVRKFFVEAKKPSVNVKEDADPAFQVRRYAWSAKLPLSILTDFQEMAIYDCRLKPTKTDGPVKARILYFTYKDYIEKWEEIASIFSRDAVLKGSFDAYAEKTKQKKGTEEVDKAFLKEIEKWRELLAKNIALKNPELSQRELNYAVQVTIDRLVFLRICEDRGIENYARLLAEVNGTNIYGRLKQHFRDADDRYNSGLFHFENEKDQSEMPDTLTLGLNIDDAVLKEIISHLYYPESPYEFSVLSADILGQVYEQFLGKVIRLTDGHRAKIEEKPEVRKAGGVYYTPTYIVKYIVENTIGKLVEGKTPKEVAQLKLCDPACGSGSFLLGAYQFLLDWHLKCYTENDPKKWNKQLTQGPKGDWRLTTAERKRILLSNIYGVDIDAQAVEVTKLSLLLKVLEGETEQSLKPQLSMFKERALPNLSSNIKCGNSLIGPEFYTGQQLNLLDAEEQFRINVFDWEKAFPQIFSDENAGFDVIIGNPPYVRIQAMKEWAPVEVEYYKKRYASASKGNYDIYVVFVERGLSFLSKNGLLGYILPHKFFNAQYGETLRQILSKGKHLQEVIHFGDEQVFKGATTYTCLLFLSKESNATLVFEKVSDLDQWRQNKLALLQGVDEVQGKNLKGDISQPSETEWNFMVGEGSELFERLRKMPTKLMDVADRIFQGLVTGADNVFILKDIDDGKFFSEENQKEYKLESDLMHPLCKGSVNICRYHIVAPTKSILFPYELVDGKAELLLEGKLKSNYPLIWNYLCDHRETLEAREKGKWKHDHWYAFGRSQNLSEMEQKKILTPSIANSASFTLDESGTYYFVGSGGGGGGGYGITIKKDSDLQYEYLLGLLNSKLLDALLKSSSTNFSGGYFAYNRQYIEQLPISIPRLPAEQNKMTDLVKQILKLHQQIKVVKTPQEQDLLKRQIESHEKQIDQLVYEWYGLTTAEVSIIHSRSEQ